MGYRTEIDGLEVFVEDKSQKNFIYHVGSVLEKLPSKVQERLCKKVAIKITGMEYGAHLGKIDKDIILLNWFNIKINRCPKKEIQYIIAHEFAHFILNHKGLEEADFVTVCLVQEKEAEELATKWGFPPYKNKQ